MGNEIPSIWHVPKSKKQIEANEKVRDSRSRKFCKMMKLIFWRDYGDE